MRHCYELKHPRSPAVNYLYWWKKGHIKILNHAESWLVHNLAKLHEIEILISDILRYISIIVLEVTNVFNCTSTIAQ